MDTSKPSLGMKYVEAQIFGHRGRLATMREDHSAEKLVGSMWDALLDILESEDIVGREDRFDILSDVVSTPYFYAKTLKSKASRQVHELANSFLTAMLDALRQDLAEAGPATDEEDLNRPIYRSGVHVPAGPRPKVAATWGNKRLSFPAVLDNPGADHPDAIALAVHAVSFVIGRRNGQVS